MLLHSPYDELAPLSHVIEEYGWELLLIIKHEQPDRIREVIEEIDAIVILTPKPSMPEQDTIAVMHRLPGAPGLS